MPLLLLFLIALPFVEIAAFINVGGEIGLLPTLALIVVAGIAGAQLMRRAGYATLERVQASLARKESAVPDVLHGLTLMMAGALLFVPGFVTDVIAVLLLIPSVGTAAGRALWRALLGSTRVTVWASRSGETVIEGEYREIREDPKRLG
jgi:UPF0716 protein FxsA